MNKTYCKDSEKSLRAIKAEENGMRSIQDISEMFDLERETIEHFFEVKERHHGKDYEMLDYYDLSEVESLMDETLLEYDRQIKAEKAIPRQFGNCYVEIFNPETNQLDVFDGAIVTFKGNTVSFIHTNGTDISIKEHSRYEANLFILTGEQKQSVEWLIDELVEKGIYTANFPDGQNHYGIDRKEAKLFGATRKNLSLDFVDRSDFEKKIFALKDMNYMKQALYALKNDSETLLKTGYYFGIGAKKEREKALNKVGAEILSNPTLKNLKRVRVAPELLLGKSGMIDKIDNVLNSENYYLMLGDYFYNKVYDKSQGMDKKAALKDTLSALLQSMRVGYFNFDDGKLEAIEKRMDKFLFRRTQANAKQAFHDRLDSDHNFKRKVKNTIQSDYTDKVKIGKIAALIRSDNMPNLFINSFVFREIEEKFNVFKLEESKQSKTNERRNNKRRMA
ncbi:hypothetical protein K7J31_002856 [Vibrio parahaemolyticus]|nr:hypothetical protein [Vibrio parahaemolyticus]